MMKKILLAVIILAIAGMTASVLKNREAKRQEIAQAAKAKSAPVAVLTTNVMSMAVPDEVSTFGTVEPLTTVAVKSQITGVLVKVGFAEGQEVKEGDLLFEIDSRESVATLQQAEAVLARDRVQWENAVKEAGRQESLLKKGISAQDVRDAAVTAADMLMSVVKADEAAVAQARLQLGYCTIRSPVSGRAGTLLMHQGNLVKADDSTLVTINQIHPILVRFVLPQKELSRVRALVERGQLTVVAMPQGAGMFSETGTVTFVDNTVDENTGTIQLKARFENSRVVLWPGQFVKVVLRFSLQENAIVTPESAVLLGQQGAYVYVVDREGRVLPRPVRVERTVGGWSVIGDGLTPGEKIVTDGQLRLKPGAFVKDRSSTRSESSPAGRP